MTEQKLTQAEMVAKLAEMEIENARLRAQANPQANVTHTIRVSPKGGLQLTGINGRFGATFYAGQWESILANAGRIREALDKHKAILADVADTEAQKAEKAKSWPKSTFVPKA